MSFRVKYYLCAIFGGYDFNSCQFRVYFDKLIILIINLGVSVMMGIGFPELMIILVIIMIIFGAGKLPEIGSAFGRSIKNFKSSMKEAESEELPEESNPVDPQEATSVKTAEAPKSDAAKKEEELIDEAAKEIKESRIGTIRTAHDGLVQQSDVFTTSLGRTPGGRGRDRGVSRDAF
jgi:sec-independent protein translocase protein TatA